MTSHLEQVTLGGGCFWCLDAVFQQVRGVETVESGYSNGLAKHPTYEQVCTGQTGHAEVVRLSFDSGQIPLRDILEIFFTIHDPTTLNRQGHDAGTQYRSGIYFHTAEQQQVARQVMVEVNEWHRGRMVTELLPVDNYWPAEAYHQNYFAHHPGQGYCVAVAAPKVEKFRQTFSRYVKP